MIDFEYLNSYAVKFGFELTQKQLEQFDEYASFLVEYNQNVNLTAITNPTEIVAKHFADCILFASVLPHGVSVIDVGTGAGFPGVVAKIVRPDISLTLLDSLDKRVTFLRLLCEKLSIDADCLHGRAEEAAKTSLRQSFDVATARAVANLNMLAEFCMPFVKVGGQMIAMKGPDGAQECSDSLSALQLLGGGETSVVQQDITDVGTRTLILCAKVGNTPDKYPRSFAKIKKSPLK